MKHHISYFYNALPTASSVVRNIKVH